MSEIHGIRSVPRTAGMGMPLGRRGILIMALAVIAAGMALNWSWLTAVGAAPLILSLAPCAVMCALGLCMRGGSSSCDSKSNPAGEPEFKRD